MTTPTRSTITVRPLPRLPAGTPQRSTLVVDEGEFVVPGIESGVYQICPHEEASPQHQAIFTQRLGQDDANPDGVPVIMGTESLDGIDLRVRGAARIAAVEMRLRDVVDSPDGVERPDGTDRYAATRSAIERVFGGTEGIPVIVATGSNFPEATGRRAGGGCPGRCHSSGGWRSLSTRRANPHSAR